MDVADLDGVAVEVGDLRQQRQRVVGGDENEGAAHVQMLNDSENGGVPDGVGDDAGIKLGKRLVAATTAAAGRLLSDGQFIHAAEFNDILGRTKADATVILQSASRLVIC